MKRAAVLLLLAAVAPGAAAHPGHGGMQGHLHGWGLEHAVLLVAAIGFIVYLSRKK